MRLAFASRSSSASSSSGNFSEIVCTTLIVLPAEMPRNTTAAAVARRDLTRSGAHRAGCRLRGHIPLADPLSEWPTSIRDGGTTSRTYAAHSGPSLHREQEE